jgi:predicted acyl esterase
MGTPMTGTLQNLDTRVVERIRIPMHDGLNLSGLVYRAPGESQPVLLVRTPYTEPLSRTLPVLPALDAGFAVLVQGCRGTGRSDGELRTFENETADGLDTIAWLTRQP